MPSQMGLPEVKRAVRERIHQYCREHGDQYCRFAERIRPDYTDETAIYTRVAFAILSANSPFQASVDALQYCHATGWRPDVFTLGAMRMIPRKAEYIRAMAARPATSFLRTFGESWDTYRVRLEDTTPGLGLAKASFAACLLYPMVADLACIDTWMQKVILGRPSFTRLSQHRYRQAESWIRRIARRHGLPTFVTQWLIWDHARGSGANDHNIFPGLHKDTTPAWVAGG